MVAGANSTIEGRRREMPQISGDCDKANLLKRLSLEREREQRREKERKRVTFVTSDEVSDSNHFSKSKQVITLVEVRLHRFLVSRASRRIH